MLLELHLFLLKDSKSSENQRSSELKSNFQIKCSGSVRLRVKESGRNEDFFCINCFSCAGYIRSIHYFRPNNKHPNSLTSEFKSKF